MEEAYGSHHPYARRFRKSQLRVFIPHARNPLPLSRFRVPPEGRAMLDNRPLADRLIEQRDMVRAHLEAALQTASRSGRREMTNGERRAMDEVQALDERIKHLQAEQRRAELPPQLRNLSDRNRTMRNDAHLVYRKGGPHSWLKDQVDIAVPGRDGADEARRRLAEHADQVRHDPLFLERRDLSRTDGSGGYATPPLWLEDQYVELARPHRVFANLCSRQMLPPGTDQINIPKLLSGTTVDVQTADNTPVSNTDITDTFIRAQVQTLAGQQNIALQLIDQSPINFLDIIFNDLLAAHAVKTDTQVLSGTGANGQLLGINYQPGISTVVVGSVDAPGIYKALANSIQTIHTTRYVAPTVVICHPRRFAWLTSLLDSQNRPLVVPYVQGPMNAAAVQTDVAAEGPVGTILGLPIYVDPSITTTASASASGSGTEDVMYCMRAQDLMLFESNLRSRVMMEPLAAHLTVMAQVYSYAAFLVRFPASVVIIEGLSAPTF